ncbi:nickel pincer cofactor biosynthesis protein LarB [Zongyangia hominis]|uniref:Nickel pincer cofactor biosynthesis protein LarB n=1 Tax=Zongyangia hominis TaxID=2763677 RepID=A0A926I610_9FIRM|nr:nickel pincer cofactor biosynthesis protein LarB [Zongyangia hominis]MBC8569504.1 nickel pincer cofactor biosynthesis protein LarB [Zongyangia hominis]
MDTMELLRQVKEGRMNIEEAAEALKKLPYEDLGFAKLDHHRSLRTGFGEVVYCQSKTPGQNAEIFSHFFAMGKSVLGTRADQEQYEAVKKAVPCAEYDPVSRCITAREKPVRPRGQIAVCTGGTSDLPVAEEAAQVAEFFGARVSRFYDVGVAGIHRLFANMEQIGQANCIVAVAGMEGALPGVVAGLTDKPVIAVPTSVGYGASFGGLSALLTMLNSCAEGIGVVNIDNGFGAGYLAAQINRLAAGKEEDER